MFQAAVDAGRPVQPLRLNYHHRDGSPSTVAAYVGDDTLLASIRRLVTARRTIVHVQVESLQLPGDGPARPGGPLRDGGPRRHGATGARATRWWPDHGFRAAALRRLNWTGYDH